MSVGVREVLSHHQRGVEVPIELLVVLPTLHPVVVGKERAVVVRPVVVSRKRAVVGRILQFEVVVVVRLRLDVCVPPWPFSSDPPPIEKLHQVRE